jgi:hypothetical protein
MTLAELTEPTREALELVRDGDQFKWYVVWLLIAVLWMYSVEVQRRAWPVVAAGLALWLADWINEILNSLFLEANGTAPFWATTGPTSYQILVGLNVEISLMFAIYGLAFAKMLPADRDRRVLGVNNRLALALTFSVLSVGIEVLLNQLDVLHWHWWWWDWPFVPLIVVFGYLWFFLAAAHAHDLPSDRERFRFVARLGAVAASLALAAGVLGWL